ncbi:hypothetical protein ZWY2020_010684 [Hordeum vulgare]|nr:hypothetical protein ZWY2020_010684 [Hordeum vulgare]
MPHDHLLTSRYIFLPHSYFCFRITDVGSPLWHFNEQTNPIPQRADLCVLVMAKAPNEGDFPLDQPPVGGLPDLNEEIARSAPHEAIMSELSSCVETIFEEVGTQVPLEEGRSLHDFTQTQVLWDGEGEGEDTLQDIFGTYVEEGEESEFVRTAANLARKYRHAEVGEPERTDPEDPVVEPEAHSMKYLEGTEENDGVKEAGPSSSRKHKRWDDDSGGYGVSPDPVEIIYEGDAQTCPADVDKMRSRYPSLQIEIPRPPIPVG